MRWNIDPWTDGWAFCEHLWMDASIPIELEWEEWN